MRLTPEFVSDRRLDKIYSLDYRADRALYSAKNQTTRMRDLLSPRIFFIL